MPTTKTITNIIIAITCLTPAAAGPLSISGPAKVTDGDTIIIDGTRIRIQGLDAEEMNMPNGPKATVEMRNIIGEQVITCRLDGTRSYNRMVGSCYLPDSTDIARELVHRGWALDCAHFSHGRYRADEPVGVRQKLSQAPYC